MQGIKSVIFFVALCWASFTLQSVLPTVNYGIQPRTVHGLIGIVTSPFLHGSLQHLIANSGGLIIFGLIFGLLERKNAGRIIGSIILIQGTLTWIFARDGNHIGASGLVFGLFGYLLCLGYFQKKVLYFFVSLFVAITYGSLIFGILPLTRGVSWEAHLFGLFAGGINAKYKV